jgi:hypothetical protein
MDTDDFGEDDLLGTSARMPMHGFLAATEPVDVTVPLFWKGKRHGEVTLRLRFVPAAAPAIGLAKSLQIRDRRR